MGLINKSYTVTLNQRVQGSSPCAPTKFFNNTNTLYTSAKLVATITKVIKIYKAKFAAKAGLKTRELAIHCD
jgi:hypothetical protein